MNYSEPIRTCDIANGEGIRVSLFVSGCENRCPGCFQPELWNYTYGKPFTEKEEQFILDSCKPDYISGLTILGGDPMMPKNQLGIINLLRKFKEQYKDKTIWLYTGLTYEELKSEQKWRTNVTDEILSLIDVLVDGRFVLEKKDITLKFRGSSNQRILHLRNGNIDSCCK